MSDRSYLISKLQTYKQIVENEIKDPVATQLLAETIQELSFESTAKRPTGEWKIGGKTTHYHYCSICGNDGDLQDNFCPNCGAKMKGDK